MACVHYEKKDKVAYITLEGDTSLNAVTSQMEEDLFNIYEDFRDDRHTHVAIITGTGEKAFSVGGDFTKIREGGYDSKWFTPEVQLDRYWWPYDTGYSGHTKLQRVAMNLDKPVIAAVNGYCLAAGFMFILEAADIRIAAEHAKFGFPENRRGLPGGSAVSDIMRQIPRAFAMYMILTGDMVDAATALQYGLVNEVVTLERLLPRAEEIAARICDVPLLVLKAEKQAALNTLYWPREAMIRHTYMQHAMALLEPDAMKAFQAFFKGAR